MAVGAPLLRLMPPLEDSPSEPRCYGSPAKCAMKRECMKVERVSSFQRLLDRAAQVRVPHAKPYAGRVRASHCMPSQPCGELA